MQSLTLRSHCAYIVQDDIHIFRFEQASRRAVDEWLRHLDRAYARIAPGEPMRCVVEYGIRGMPHLSYSTQRLRFWMHDKPDLPPTYVAVVHNNPELARLVDGIVRFLFPNGPQIRFVPFEQYDVAFSWLHHSG